MIQVLLKKNILIYFLHRNSENKFCANLNQARKKKIFKFI